MWGKGLLLAKIVFVLALFYIFFRYFGLVSIQKFLKKGILVSVSEVSIYIVTDNTPAAAGRSPTARARCRPPASPSVPATPAPT